ncbi:MAG: hypothetical protein FWB92_11115 [Oscillospiraceae bacterium]|nr:hypothetical protein [Oscillospiraceae bacterium]
MSVLDALRDLNNQTEWQRMADRARQIDESMERGRNVGGNMGKNDFLMLLSAQLRHQDPLNPSSDSEFASQLAQFTSLEQMQNMNSSLETMASMQSYSLVGKFVIAEQWINGELVEIPGEVDSIFTRDGVTFAQIGEHAVPISAIREVFNTSNLLTSDRLLQTSSALIGREILASVDGEDVTGVVQRIVVDRGTMFAQLDTLGSDGRPMFVPVNSIVDIGEVGSQVRQKPETPPDAENFRNDPNGGFFEVTEDGSEVIGRWDWDEMLWRWEFTPITQENGPGNENGNGNGSGNGNGNGNGPANGPGNGYDNSPGSGPGNGPGSGYDNAA